MCALRLPPLITARLVVRDFTLEDAAARRRIMQEGFGEAISEADNAAWMQWTVLNYAQLAAFYQPPYGERAICLKADGGDPGPVIGILGLVPSVIPWGVLPEYRAPEQAAHTFTAPEFGLFWAVAADQRGHGYAAEAARPLIAWVFEVLRARRMVATTEYDNLASQRVMARLGMTLARNPGDDPPWFQVIGVLENPALREDAAATPPLAR